MKISIPRQLDHYLTAMGSSALDAGIRALVLFCGMAGAHQQAAGIPPMPNGSLSYIFLIAFAHACLDYLSKHPVQELVEEIETTTAAPAPAVIQTIESAVGAPPAK